MGTPHLLLLALLAPLAVSPAAAATFDRALTSAAKAGLQEPKVFLSFHNISPGRKSSSLVSSHQSLLSLAFPGHSRLLVILDRSRGRVIMESMVNGEMTSHEIAAPTLKPRSKVRSLLVEIDQEINNANIYFDCRLLGSLDLPKAPRDMASDLSGLRVYRDRQTEVGVDWNTSVLTLLEKLGCPDGKETGDVQAQANEVYTYRRGDIPIDAGEETCTLLAKTISELIETIKELQIEIQTQREETALLRDALLNCEACKPDNDPCSPNPCYPGVSCSRGPNGPLCGNCPRGFIGDGINCVPGTTCADRPCALAHIIIVEKNNGFNLTTPYINPLLFVPPTKYPPYFLLDY